MTEFFSPDQAVKHYNLSTNPENLSEFGKELAEHGIAAVEMPLSPDDFKRFSEGFAIALEECPEELKKTFHRFDVRYGSEAGHTRKDTKFNNEGLQIADPKDYFHFPESAQSPWREQFASGPKVLRDFLEEGFEIHDALISVAKKMFRELESSHPNISDLHFPGDDSFSVLRLLRYGGYEPHENMLAVATAHNDISSGTVQAYADAPGFWGARDGEHGERTYYDTQLGKAFAFMGEGHEKVYGEDDVFRPLYHGVDRIIPAGVTWVPERTAVILFVNTPEVDCGVNMQDTRPYIKRGMARSALASV